MRQDFSKLPSSRKIGVWSKTIFSKELWTTQLKSLSHFLDTKNRSNLETIDYSIPYTRCKTPQQREISQLSSSMNFENLLMVEVNLILTIDKSLVSYKESMSHPNFSFAQCEGSLQALAH